MDETISTGKYNFKKFTDKHSLKVESFISVYRTKSILLSKKFIIDNNLDDCRHVQLHYDGNNNAIGLEFSNDYTKGHYTVAVGRDAGKITPHVFFKKNNINAEEVAGRYTPEVIKTDDGATLFVIKLEKTS